MDGIEWKQYEPPAISEMVKGQGKGHNSASISVFVRSLISREWARAMGKKPVQRKPSPQSSPIGRWEKDGLYGIR